MAVLPLAIWAYDVLIDGIYYNLSGAGATVTNENGYGAQTTYTGSVTIPSEITVDGTTYSVTGIDPDAFYQGSEVTSVDIPNRVTSIGARAFRGCTGLTSIEIPSSVTSIGRYAFEDCSSLTNIGVEGGNSIYDSRDNCNAIVETESNTLIVGCKTTVIPSSVTSIGDYAFSGCTGLTSVEIPNSVTSIGSSAFIRCSNLTSIAVESGNSKYDSRDNCNAIIETESNTLIVGCKTTVIPSSVTSIGDYAFDGCAGLTSVEIPSSVTSIGSVAFSGCTGLTSVEIPSSVTSIGSGAFSGCDNLTKVTINSNDIVSATYTYFKNLENVFGPQISELVLGSEVERIGNYAISMFTNLTTVEIPSSVTSIGSSAFYRCTGLTSVEIPSSVTNIGSSAFGRCSNLTSIAVESGNSKYDSRDNCNAIIETESNTLIIGCKTTVIPSSVTNIGNDAFYGCTGLTSVEIPSSVTSIGNYAFRGCDNLTKVIINSDTIVSATYTSSSNLGNVFGSQVSEYVLGSEVKGIGSFAFYGCTGLTSVTILDGVMSIGSFAFRGCTGLTSVEIPSSVTSIGICAFYGCTGLTSVTILDGVTSIGSSAFSGCTGLTSVEIPSSVTSIGSSAFANCDSISRVNITDMTAWMRIKFMDNRSNPTWFAKSLYLNGEEVTDVVVPEEITEIGDYVFKQVETLKTIKMHNGITSIGTCAFQGCFNLQSFDLPTSLETIGNNAFQQCISLDKPIDLSKTKVDSIADIAFYMCYKLPAVTLPANLKYLGERSFGTDTCLVSVTSLVEDPSTILPAKYTRLPFHCFDTVGYVVDNQTIYHNATLYVPKGTSEAYRNSVAFANFENIVETDLSSINDFAITDDIGTQGTVSWFTLKGQRVNAPTKGLYIRRSASEPMGRKVFVK